MVKKAALKTAGITMAGFRKSFVNTDVGMSQKAIIPSTNSERCPWVLGPVRR